MTQSVPLGLAATGGEFDRPVRSLQLHQILRLVRRRKRFIAAVATAGTLLTAIAAFAIPPSYTATAQLLVEPSSSEISAGLLEPVVDTHIGKLTSDARLRHMLTNLSGAAALDISVEADANATPNFEERVRAWLGEIVGGLKRVAGVLSQSNDTEKVATNIPTLEQVKKVLLVRQERRSNIVAISYTDKSPEKAALIANQILLSHVQQLQDQRQEESERLRGWLAERIAAVRAELEEAERVVRSHHAAYGVKSADPIGADAIADTIRQVAILQSEISERQARRNRLSAARAETHEEQTGTTRTDETPANGPAGRGNAQTEQNGASANEQSAQALAQLDREIRVLQSQLRSLEQRLEGLRAAASSSLEEQMESHALELRAASAKKLLDDLVRRQQEVSEAAHSRSIGARVLALAPTPLRPSSISPYLLIPPAVFAFALLGAAISVFRTQLDRTLQSEPEVIAELGIPCLGAVSQLPSSRSAPDYRALVDQRSQPFSQSIRSTAITALNAIPPRYDARAILVTPCVSSEAATATALSMGIGVCIARLGHHVLVIAFGALDGSSGPVLDRSADRGAQLHDQSISAAVQHDAQLGLDCFSVRQISGDPMSLVASQQFTDILHRLRARYDCIIIDAPSVFSSAEVRLLATKVDGAILAIKCGSTHRDAAVTASQLLRQVSPLGEPAAKVYAVLTDVYATAHSEFDR